MMILSVSREFYPYGSLVGRKSGRSEDFVTEGSLMRVYQLYVGLSYLLREMLSLRQIDPSDLHPAFDRNLDCQDDALLSPSNPVSTLPQSLSPYLPAL